MATIGVLMKTDTVTAAPDETVAVVAQRMMDRRIGAVMVIRDGELVGLFSERDLLTRVVAVGKDPCQTAVGSVATGEVITVERDTPVKRCAQILKAEKFRHLPVLVDGRPVGIVSARDLLEFVVDGLERFIDQARYEQQLLDGKDPYDHFGGGYGR